MLKLNTNNTLKLIGKLFSFPKSELPHCRLCEQWGTYNMNSQSVSVTFPISFFNSCLNVIGVATRANDSDGKTPGYDATSISKTGFICTNGTNHLVNLNMRYLAIGK